jgi:aromatic ring-opening dioxygenase LigB subunit
MMPGFLHQLWTRFTVIPHIDEVDSQKEEADSRIEKVVSHIGEVDTHT